MLIDKFSPFNFCSIYFATDRRMEINKIGSDKGENDNAVIPSEDWDNTPLN